MKICWSGFDRRDFLHMHWVWVTLDGIYVLWINMMHVCYKNTCQKGNSRRMNGFLVIRQKHTHMHPLPLWYKLRLKYAWDEFFNMDLWGHIDQLEGCYNYHERIIP